LHSSVKYIHKLTFLIYILLTLKERSSGSVSAVAEKQEKKKAGI
jgi:hypothetical protein